MCILRMEGLKRSRRGEDQITSRKRFFAGQSTMRGSRREKCRREQRPAMTDLKISVCLDRRVLSAALVDILYS